jgi:hypothetical protein
MVGALEKIEVCQKNTPKKPKPSSLNALLNKQQQMQAIKPLVLLLCTVQQHLSCLQFAIRIS